jgi:hypothetical protein
MGRWRGERERERERFGRRKKGEEMVKR